MGGRQNSLGLYSKLDMQWLKAKLLSLVLFRKHILHYNFLHYRYQEQGKRHYKSDHLFPKPLSKGVFKIYLAEKHSAMEIGNGSILIHENNNASSVPH